MENQEGTTNENKPTEPTVAETTAAGGASASESTGQAAEANLIELTIKTPKEKETVHVAAEASVKDVS